MTNPSTEQIEAAAEAIYGQEKAAAVHRDLWPTWAELAGKAGQIEANVRRGRAKFALIAADGVPASGSTSDGHHTFDELYDYRMLYNAHAARGWLAAGIPVVKSWKHSDGELCFGGGWFIVTATLPTGQVSNHYKAEHWGLFAVPEVVLPPEYDGHTPDDAAERLRAAAGVTPQEPARVEEALRFCTCSHWLEAHRDRECMEFACACKSFAPVVQVDEAKLPAVTRVTLAGRAGTLSAEHWDYAGVEILVQDDGRTLKVLPLRGGGQ